MSDKKSVRHNRIKSGKSLIEPDGLERSSKYNYTSMKEETVLAEEGFSRRLAQLRSERNVSAREMSLSLGQAAGYINSIENGNSLPSMSMFFEICEYLQITPRDFFAYTAQERPLPFIEVIRNLPEEEQYLLLALARKLGKG